MAKIRLPKDSNVKSAKKAVKKLQVPSLAEAKYTGNEPQWDTEAAMNYSDEEFDHHLRKSFYYYNYHYTTKEVRPFVIDWMQRDGDYSAAEIKLFEENGDRVLTMTTCSLILAHRAGMPLRPRHLEWIREQIALCISGGSAASKTTVEAKKKNVIKKPEEVVAQPTIQDRLREKTAETIGEIEGHFDNSLKNQPGAFKPYDFLVAQKVPQAQLNRYEDVYRTRRAELEEAQSKKDSQLTEGYRHLKAGDYKRLYAFIDSLLDAIEQYRKIKQATKKAKVRKAPSKEKLVSKMKYAKEDKSLKVVSINPAEIVGATELWTYNTKTRKLGKYVAQQFATLSVKGTTILNYDEERSVAKTLRKPAEQIKEFNKAGKIALRTFLKDIRAVEVKMNGRINAETLLLKVM